jgi:hypothetical protein
MSFALLKPNIRTMHQIELKNHYVEETGDKNTNPPRLLHNPALRRKI